VFSKGWEIFTALTNFKGRVIIVLSSYLLQAN
jgi:hypothetical protein